MNSATTAVDPRLLAQGGQARTWLDRMLLRFIRDEIDLPVARFFALMTAVSLPVALAMYATADPPWWLIGIAIISGQYFTAPYILALHVSSHRPIFRKEYRWLQTFVVWVLGPLAGQSPETYRAHHMGMHHVEENLKDDLSSTMRYQRDRFTHWLHYFGRFFFLILPELSVYMYRRGRTKLLRHLALGEVSYLVAVALLFWLNWKATLVVFVFRFFMTRFGLMAGNWTQHAFIDPADPANPYKNSISLIDTSYNRLCFNDGFHIGHHVKPNRHWSEMADDFVANKDRYAAEGAIVFRGLDYFQIWALLMMKRHAKLAEHLVVWPGQDPSIEARVALIKSRLQPVSD